MDFLLVREDEKATEPRLTSTLKALLSAFDTAAHGIESRKKQGKGRTPHFEDFDRLHWEGWLMEGLKIIYKAITGKTPTQSAYEYGEYTTFEKFASEIIRLINIELKGRGCYISISPKSRLKHKNCHKSP
jgi:hypothetical protein